MLSYLIFNFSFSMTLYRHIRYSSDMNIYISFILAGIYFQNSCFSRSLPVQVIIERDLKILSSAWRENNFT